MSVCVGGYYLLSLHGMERRECGVEVLLLKLH